MDPNEPTQIFFLDNQTCYQLSLSGDPEILQTLDSRILVEPIIDNSKKVLDKISKAVILQVI